MEKLIAALEAATESSFELNAAIARLDFYREAHGDLADNEVPDFCASIDAALMLVNVNEKHWPWWTLEGINPNRPLQFKAHVWPTSGSHFCSFGATPAIALCIAALRARASISSKELVGS